MIHGDATGLPLPDSSVYAFRMENVSACEPDARLRAKQLDVAEAAKVVLQAVDK